MLSGLSLIDAQLCEHQPRRPGDAQGGGGGQALPPFPFGTSRRWHRCEDLCGLWQPLLGKICQFFAAPPTCLRLWRWTTLPCVLPPSPQRAERKSHSCRAHSYLKGTVLQEQPGSKKRQPGLDPSFRRPHTHTHSKTDVLSHSCRRSEPTHGSLDLLFQQNPWSVGLFSV